MKHLKPILATVSASAMAAVVFASAFSTDYRPLDRNRSVTDGSSGLKMTPTNHAHGYLSRGDAESEAGMAGMRKSAPADGTSLMKWDFSGCTAGTEDAPDAVQIGELDWNTYGEGAIDSKYMGEEGWTGMGVCQAGGMIYLDPAATGFGMASITTPQLSVPATFTVRVKVRATANDECTIHFASITPNPKDETFPDMKQTNNPISGEWKTVNAVFTYPEAHSDLQLQILAMNPMLIDEVEILAGEVKDESDFTPDADVTHPEDAEMIVDEDFSLFTEGSVEEPSTTSLTADWIIDGAYTHHPGWSGNNVSMAGGAAALVNNLDRCINTYPTDLSGHVTVTFRVYGYETIVPLYCSLMREPYSTNPALLGQKMERVRTKDRWTWMRFEFDNVDGSEDCYIQFRPFAKCLIDDVKISTQNTIIAQPRLLPASDFSIDGFTANWGAVKKAEDYLLSVYQEQPENPGATVDFAESFENTAGGKAPEGWDFAIAGEPVGEKASDGKVSVKLSANGDHIDLPANGGKIQTLSIDALAFGGKDNMGYYNAHLYLETFDGYRWEEVSGYWVFGAEEYRTFKLDKDVAGAYSARLVVRNLSEGDYLLIDNVRWSTTTATERIYAVQDLPVATTSYRMEKLDPTGDYYYTVKARNTSMGLVSEVTSAMDAFGVAAPVAIDATEVSARGAFTANWQNVPKATSYGIKTYSVYTAQADETRHEVMAESFSKVKSIGTPEAPESLGNMQLINLSELTDNSGWYGFLTIVCDGAMGATSVVDYGLRGELQTPELSLSNNGGTCHVEIEAYGVPGDRVIIINQNGDGLAMEGYGEFTTYYGDIPNCGENEILTFYSEQFQNFYIRSITVSQDLKGGDKVSTLLSTEGAPTESQRISGLEAGKEYAYDVYSIYNRYSDMCVSPLSNRVYVSLVSGIEGNEYEGLRITQSNDLIKVESPCDIALTVTDLGGVKVVDKTCAAGETTVSIPAPGIYIVKAGEKSVKIMVR